MRFVTVTLTAADDGVRLTLYDANGRKVGSVSKEAARPASDKSLTKILWARKFKAMSIVILRFAKAIAGRPELQMRIDWRGVDASAFVA
jgi:hypothetical protein